MPRGYCSGEKVNRGLRGVGEGENLLLLISIRNAGAVRIGVNGEEPCCAAEGYAPDDGELCCISGERRPLDYRTAGSGRCGCPSGFGWNVIAQSCLPSAGQVCYSSDENERESQGLSCAFRWFTQQWWNDAFNDNLLDCFRTENQKLTQVCCPYTEYDGKEYGEFEDIVVY